MATIKDQLAGVYEVKVKNALTKTVRAIALVIHGELTNTTPVDTGRARSNWLPSLNTPRNDTVAPNQGERVDGVLKEYDIKDTIFITNNLPYIQRLNDGYSKQAPSGFVDIAIQRGKRIAK